MGLAAVMGIEDGHGFWHKDRHGNGHRYGHEKILGMGMGIGMEMGTRMCMELFRSWEWGCA